MTKTLLGLFSLTGLLYGLAAWATAFLAGVIYMKVMGIDDKETALADNLLHAIAFGVLIAATIIFYLRLRSAGDFGMMTANSFFAVNVVLDIIVLIGFMKFDLIKWLQFGVSGYVIIFYGFYLLLRK